MIFIHTSVTYSSGLKDILNITIYNFLKYPIYRGEATGNNAV